MRAFSASWNAGWDLAMRRRTSCKRPSSAVLAGASPYEALSRPQRGFTGSYATRSSIITAVLFIYLTGQTLNTMTLGGFALAIGILVDNGTVVIEVNPANRQGWLPKPIWDFLNARTSSKG